MIELIDVFVLFKFVDNLVIVSSERMQGVVDVVERVSPTLGVAEPNLVVLEVPIRGGCHLLRTVDHAELRGVREQIAEYIAR